MTDELVTRVRAWIADDPDPDTRAELEALLAANDRDELEAWFAGPLEFGTAGLRGRMGGGPSRMNRRVVIRTASGLASYLEANVPDAARRGVAVGFDARRLSSVFADDVIGILTARGFVVHAFREPVPTPLVAFALLDVGAAAACVLTASHNPPADNGLKVYWENGAQIVPPHDAGIAAAIDAAPDVAAIARLTVEEATARNLLRPLGEPIRRRYRAGVQALFGGARATAPLRLAYTALHGVGEATALAVLHDAGFDDVFHVASQATPDGSFPTVRSPNPEEPSAMSELLATARSVGAELAIANDPDADRLAVAVRHRGELVVLSGNELGCLLGDFLLARSHAAKKLVLSTIVSSPLLGAIAASHGARWETTLTGHKWIQTRAMELERDGYHTVFGYEEALGYAVGALVRDKDGLSAAVAVALAASEARAEGRTLVDVLDDLARRHGLYRSRQLSRTHEGKAGLARLDALVAAFRATPPTELGGHRVVSRDDLVSGLRTAADGSTHALALPKSNVLAFELEGGHRVMLRPSGTEPKLKVYLDVRTDVADGESLASARARADALLDDLARSVEARLV